MPTDSPRGRKVTQKSPSSKPSQRPPSSLSARPPSPKHQSRYVRRELPSPAEQLRAHIAVSNYQKEDIDKQLFPSSASPRSSSRTSSTPANTPAAPPSSPNIPSKKILPTAVQPIALPSSPSLSSSLIHSSHRNNTAQNNPLISRSVAPKQVDHVNPQHEDGGALCSSRSIVVDNDSPNPEDGGALCSARSIAVDNDQLGSQDGGALCSTPSIAVDNDVPQPEDGGGLCSVRSIAVGNDDDEEDEDAAPSLTSVQRGGNRRSVPATKSELQAAFEAAAAAQNAENDGLTVGGGDTDHKDSIRGIDDAAGEEDAGDAPSFAGVGRGGTFRMDNAPRKVPDAAKALEFDGSPGKSPGDDTNTFSRLSSMCTTLAEGCARDKEMAMFHLQKVLPEIEAGKMDLSRIVGTICNQVITWDRSLQITSAETLQKIVTLPVPDGLAKRICDLAFHILREPVGARFYEAWGDVLVRTVPLIHWKVEQVENYFDILDNKTNEETLVAKRLVARLIGFFALGLDPHSVKSFILPRAIAFATERDVDIRGMIAESISNIGSQLNISVVEREMWPCVRSLMKDTNTCVRAAAIRSVADLAMNLKEHYSDSLLFTKLLRNLFLRCCREARELGGQDLRFVTDLEYLKLEIKALIFGKLLVSVFENLDKSTERREALKAYVTMAGCNAPVVRRHCAYSLPGVTSVFSCRYRSELCSLIAHFVKDNDAETRWKLAAGFHETVKLLAGRDTVDALYKAACSLLADSNPLVRLNVVRHFHETISELAKQSGYASASVLAPLFANVHLQLHGNWRAQELLATQLRHSAKLVPPPTIASNVLPTLFNIAAGTTWLVRKEIMQGVATCLRYMSDTAVREVAMDDFKRNWARSKRYWRRLSFVYAAEAAVTTYSRLLFRDTFAVALLKLAVDPVSNVRLRLASVLEKFAPAVHTLEEYEIAVKSLKQDEDRDVQIAMVDYDVRTKKILEESTQKFEKDLDLEEEEQAMYSRHLKAQRTVAKKYHMKPLSPRLMKPAEIPSSVHIIKDGGGDKKGQASQGASLSVMQSKDDLDLRHQASPSRNERPKRSASVGINSVKDKSGKSLRQVFRIPNKGRPS